jgi:hypothetical protein
LFCFELFDARFEPVFDEFDEVDEELPELIFSDLIAAVVEKLVMVGVTGK